MKTWQKQETSLPRFLLAAAIILGAALVVILGVVYYHFHLDQVKERASMELQAMSVLKADEIRGWVEEREGDVQVLAELPGVREAAARVAENPEDSAARARLQTYIASYISHYGYTKAVLFGPDLRAVLSVPEGSHAPDRATPDALLSSSRTGTLQLSQLRAEPDGSIQLELYAPVPGPTGSSFRGTIMLCSDPRRRLFPILRKLAAPRSSAETILVRLEGEHVDYLSPLRNWSGAVPTPDTGAFPPLSGDIIRNAGASLWEALDHRGEPVVGVVQPVQGTPWLVLSKVDRAELLQPVFRESGQVAIGLALFQSVLGLGAGYWWRHRKGAMLATQMELERSRVAVTERLGLVMRHANDVILLIDSEMRIIEANERVEAVYGRTAAATKGLKLQALRAPSTLPSLEADYARVFKVGGHVFETIHRRADGSEFPVEVSARAIEVDGQRQALSLIRDITDRRAHEEEILRLGRLYLVVSQIDRALVKAKDSNSMFVEICRVLVDDGGFRLAMVGWLNPDTKWIHPVAVAGEAAGYATNFRISADERRPEGLGPGGRSVRECRTQIGNDYMIEPGTELWRPRAAEAGIRSIIGIPLWRRGMVVGTLLVYAGEVGFFQEQEVLLLEAAARDISFALDVFAGDDERRRSEEALLRSFRQIQALQAVAAALEKPGATPADVLRSVAGDIAGMLRFPSDAAARIDWKGEVFAGGETGMFVGHLAEPIIVNGQPAGLLELGYVREVPPSDEGIFLKAERETAAAIARTLGLGFSARESYAAVQNFNVELEAKVGIRTAELDAHRRELQALLDAIPDMVIRLRRDGTVVFCRETVGMKHSLCLDCAGPGAHPCGMKEPVRQACLDLGLESLSANHLRTSEVPLEQGAGQATLELRAAPITSEEFVVFIRDITERRRLEEEREAMLRREREVSEMKTRFISVASHEFRTPMAAILGSVELLANHQDRLPAAKRQELFGRIGSSVERMRLMLEDVLTLNRMEANRTRVNRVTCDLGKIVSDAVEEVRLGDRGAHRFEFQPPESPLLVNSDPALLVHILSNLLSNGVRYSPVGTCVRALIAVEGTTVRLAVEDEGIGIPEADRGRIFEPFERGSNVGTIKGTGLGLNIVKRMTELLGGTVLVEDGVSRGCRFVVTLPGALPDHP